MEKFTQEFILNLKKRNGNEINLYDAAINFMSKKTDTPKEHYDEHKVYKIIREFFADFVSTNEHNTLLFYDFTEYLDRSIGCHYWVENGASSNKEMLHNITISMLAALENVQVRESDKSGGYYCINGFTDEVVHSICDD